VSVWRLVQDDFADRLVALHYDTLLLAVRVLDPAPLQDLRQVCLGHIIGERSVAEYAL
jgi:hypothetical protein